MSEPEPDPEYSLVMPFVAVASKGGPFNDQAYVAGYEMGKLDQQLAETGSGRIFQTILAANRTQADLIAMRHGWKAVWHPYDDTWTGVEFVRVDPGSTT